MLSKTETLDTRKLLSALVAMKRGDFSVHLPQEWEGIGGKIADAFNDIADTNGKITKEIERVSRIIGKDGKISQRIEFKGMNGSWAQTFTTLNDLLDDLVWPVTETSRVIGAVAKGDLSQTIPLEIEGGPLKGEFLTMTKTVNTMVERLGTFTAEVTRVSREVGTEGKLGGQAVVKGVAGTWKDLTESVNSMASNLTAQVRNIAEVTISVANGDLSKKITVDVRGEFLQLKDTMNTMVDQLRSFAGEVTRVAREVGTEGKLGGQAVVPGVAGVWKDLTDSVNSMGSNLTGQVRNIAEVTTAVASGDLTRKITVDVQGEILELKKTINTMVDQLNAFASEVTRVAREVGTEGKLGGQAIVPGVAGTWKDLTENVNFMAANLTSQVRNIAQVTTSVATGDLSKKITVDAKGEILELKNTINTMVDQLNAFASEVTRVAGEVGTEGKLGGQAVVKGVGGTWKDLTDNVNLMAANLTNQVRNIAQVTTAVATGDLSKKITVDVKGEILELKNTINTMVDQLNAFASEVTRVAREVGTEGKLGGQAMVKGVAGTWKDLTENVNFMAANLTDQVRGIVKVVTAVATGDLKQKLTVAAKGEIAALAGTINSMIDTLATFAAQVTSVAREVGIEGRLGGQANVPGAAGTWRDLTDNVNQLAANLTTQVRAIAEVATAVAKGDLSRTITVETKGEVAELKDNINQMISNLKETTNKNTEQDWLKTNLAKFTQMMQGQREMVTVARTLMSELAPLVNAQHGVFYLMGDSGDKEGAKSDGMLKLITSYGFKERKNIANQWHIGEGLVGQCAFEKQRIMLTNVPGDYIKITSGLGEGTPLNIIVMPILFEGNVKAVIEMASFNRFSEIHQTFLDQLTESIGIILNTIEAGSRTESLLKQSQGLAQELQAQQEELQQTNEELEEKARLLEDQKTEVEKKNREIELARFSLEDKAEQLAISSKYKSEFLANMSHELRTPLNSLLILSQELTENPQKNLNDQQIEFAETIHKSGQDLLNLINDILDLSKIESGTVTLELAEIPLSSISQDIERTFRHVADSKKLDFKILTDKALPPTIRSDSKRLQQVLKNLLSNAFKFTERGHVAMRIFAAKSGWSRDNKILNQAPLVVGFAVSDSGIGIPADKQKIIFEAFQQADGSTSRKYGGTGLGLSISRGIAELLHGEITPKSEVGEGSTFTLYIPQGIPLPLTEVTIKPEQKEAGNIPAPEAAKKGTKPQIEVKLETSAQAPPSSEAVSIPQVVPDDRSTITPRDKIVLIIEDDPKFAQILTDIARQKGFKVITAGSGEAALALVRQYAPDAITLDIRLPDIDGWTVLDRLKLNPALRHIPVHIITVEEERLRALDRGAFAYLEKPVSKETLYNAFSAIKDYIGREKKLLLLIEDNKTDQENIIKLIGNEDVLITAVATGNEAWKAMQSKKFDCIVLDLMLPDISGIEILERMVRDPKLKEIPVVVYTGKEISRRDEAQLKKMAREVIVKGPRSVERLLDETSLFLHRVISKMPEEKRKIVEHLYQADTALANKKVLIVDDDVRNIFALTSLLERHGVKVLSSENGRLAIETLDKTEGIDLVLMDIMMPEMDGYETMHVIRKDPRFRTIPIIALTAKAMKGDREKCIEAGASDYITKPIDTSQLLSLMRVWMYKK